MNPLQSSLDIVPVKGRKMLDQFIRLPWSLYQNDPMWVPPLLLERREHLTSKNPFFKHARWQAWLALDKGKAVGRISAQIDELFLSRYNSPVGYFGMLEAEDNEAVFSALLHTAESWLREQGIHEVRGPFNLSINDECGLLVDGFDTSPSMMMGHSRPYFAKQLENQAYTKAKDLLAYHIHPDFEAPSVMTALLQKTRQQATVRPLQRKQLDKELSILKDIFNDAWSDNWGFVPFTADEFKEMGHNITKLIGDDFIQIAEIDKEPVAMIVALPNLNAIIKDLNGKLFPTGLLKLLWRLKVKYPDSARIPLMGVRKRFQHSRLGPGLAFLVIDAVRQALIARGVKEVEMSWILEDNDGMCNIIETIGGVAYKRYRIYQKPLAAST